MAFTVSTVSYVRNSDGKFRPSNYELGQNTPYFTLRSGRLEKDGTTTATLTITTPQVIVATATTPERVLPVSFSLTVRAPKGTLMSAIDTALVNFTSLNSAARVKNLVSGGTGDV